ncbi:isochorismatase family protein [Actinomadura sp. NTSP31]|uniref:isochorismatase family protein n=1 Tax=Actinomadura sp. NTSP31 TaxID=1735447 RepID=UPI0035C147F0
MTRPGSEPLVHKTYGKAGIGRLVVTGAETDACVRPAIHGAFTRGYDVTRVGDAHTVPDNSQY